MTARIRDFHNKSATLTANGINDFFGDAVNSVRLSTQLIPFDQFPREDLPDALKIPYRQFDFINVVALLDQDGNQLVEPAFEANPKSNQAAKNHESVTAKEVEIFGSHIPLKAALETGTSFSNVYFNSRTQTPRIALAVSFPVKQGKSSWVLAVEFSLKTVLEKVLNIAPSANGNAFIVDGQGSVVCHTYRSLMAQRTSLKNLSIVEEGLNGNRTLSQHYHSHNGQEMAGAYAPIGLLGWGLVVGQPVKEAFISVYRMKSYTIFWVGLSLVVAILGGILLSRGVSDPIHSLVKGAEEVALGHLDWRVSVKSKDEIGRLAKTFNHMSSELEKSFKTITEQNHEIAEWNEKLKQRVEERTKELKEAEDQIIRSQKIAAVSELGAGMAHEINNPLTTILGFAQLMLRRTIPKDECDEYLSTIVAQSKRIQVIVEDLLRFSKNIDNTEYEFIDLNSLITSTLLMIENQLHERNIVIHTDLFSELPMIRGDRAQLQQVILLIITNAKIAMPDGGTLTLISREIEGGAVKVGFTDTGIGIAKKNMTKIFDLFFTTKGEWTGKGLGLSVVHQIVKEHHGKITVQSEEGEGSTFTVILPGTNQKLYPT
ncbi:MAG: HAMP domain-containing protein [Proteobacteria bacterium]|nr:HAMP domain-containing protein [Pseudomonadota bacterium]